MENLTSEKKNKLGKQTHQFVVLNSCDLGSIKLNT